MTKNWNLAIAFVVLGLLTCGFGVWTHHLADAREREVADLEAASLQLDQYERSGTLDERFRDASERKAWLNARLAAGVRGAASLDESIERLFSELDLEVTSTTPWAEPADRTSADDLKTGVAFERTMQFSGSFPNVVDALRSLEAWPDTPRVRGLEIVPESPGRVNVKLRLVVVRLLPTVVPDETDETAKG